MSGEPSSPLPAALGLARALAAHLDEMSPGERERVWEYLEPHLAKHGQHLSPGVAPFVVKVRGLHAMVRRGDREYVQAWMENIREGLNGAPVVVLDAEHESLDRVRLHQTDGLEGVTWARDIPTAADLRAEMDALKEWVGRLERAIPTAHTSQSAPIDAPQGQPEPGGQLAARFHPVTFLVNDEAVETSIPSWTWQQLVRAAGRGGELRANVYPQHPRPRVAYAYSNWNHANVLGERGELEIREGLRVFVS